MSISRDLWMKANDSPAMLILISGFSARMFLSSSLLSVHIHFELGEEMFRPRDLDG